ncbi:putative gustatory receptor 59d [Drosophila eugracilis]|uniref:putative gustatory receptor 59d n=1 Tax=Drosophila eugracilis TaxID=29029 RepID=UPI001BDA616E|nr:putative gustatory receptor 59d [Drosophila eugracilis]
MADLVKWCLYISYIYGRISGVLNFEIDLKTGIVSKYLCATATEMVQISMAFILVRKYLTIRMALGMWSVLALTGIVNVIITQYYIAIAHIRGCYMTLNKELESILYKAKSLVPSRRGVFVTKCCFLADRLDEIAKTQSELQELTDRLSKTYEVQLLCMALTFYLNSIGSIYIMFSVGKYKNMIEDWPQVAKYLAAAYFIFFYLDIWLTAYNLFHLLDVHREMVNLMEQRTLLFPGLDKRLLTAFESFELNLARNPFRLRFFGFFEADRTTCFSWCNSMIANSIFLIQYDVQNY